MVAVIAVQGLLTVPAEAIAITGRQYERKYQLVTEMLKNDEHTMMAVRDFHRTVVFFSVSDGKSKAKVFASQSPDFENALKTAYDKAKRSGITPKWFKLDVVVSGEKMDYMQFCNDYCGERIDYMRKGIAFNAYYGTALLEAQINSEGILNYETGKLDLEKVNKALGSMGKKKLSKIPEYIYLFKTQGYFAENDAYALKLTNGDYGDTGRREVPITHTSLETLAQKSSSYLSSICGSDGKFVYGYYPIDNEVIEGYNMLRHVGTTWNLILQYDMCRDDRLIPVINNAIRFIEQNIQYKNKKTAFCVDGKQLNVGGNGLMLLAYCAYAEVFGTSKYDSVIEALANGIIFMQKNDGSYIHTLNRYTYDTSKEYIIVYYDGEATYGMLRAYDILGKKKFLKSAKKAADYFIANNYETLHSHWIAYTFNELTKFAPEEKYFEFGLKNIDTDDYSAKVANTKAGINSAAETANATFELYDRLITGGYKCDYLEYFNAKRLLKAVTRRVTYNLNYFMFPEYAMYFKAPDTVVNSFVVREDYFRIRIDDIQHFMDGFYIYWKNLDRINYYSSQNLSTGKKADETTEDSTDTEIPDEETESDVPEDDGGEDENNNENENESENENENENENGNGSDEDNNHNQDSINTKI